MDDEAPTRLRLRQLLAAHSDIEVAGEADSGTQAMELTGQLRPDVILLDIQLPGCSGIDVAACLPQPRPHIVFCTAYDQYAVEAFELHAVDYLLKPVGRARLADALERIRALPATSREAGLDRALRARRSSPARFLVRSAGHYLVVAESQVLYFDSEGSLPRLIVPHLARGARQFERRGRSRAAPGRGRRGGAQGRSPPGGGPATLSRPARCAHAAASVAPCTR